MNADTQAYADSSNCVQASARLIPYPTCDAAPPKQHWSVHCVYTRHSIMHSYVGLFAPGLLMAGCVYQ